MQVTILVPDNKITIDGETRDVSLPTGSNIKTIQWYGDSGHIEFIDGQANQEIIDLTNYYQYIKLWGKLPSSIRPLIRLNDLLFISVSAFDFRKALNRLNYRTQFEKAISGSSKDIQDEWEYTNLFERTNILINDISDIIGITQEQLDTIFTKASSISKEVENLTTVDLGWYGIYDTITGAFKSSAIRTKSEAKEGSFLGVNEAVIYIGDTKSDGDITKLHASVGQPPNQPSITGCGINFYGVNTREFDGLYKTKRLISIFYGYAPVSGLSTGALSINFAGQMQDDVQWVIDEFTNINDATGGGDSYYKGILHSNNSERYNKSDLVMNGYMGAFSSANNATYTVSTHNAGISGTHHSGLTQIATSPASNGTKLVTAFKNGNDLTPTYTLPYGETTEFGAFANELVSNGSIISAANITSGEATSTTNSLTASFTPVAGKLYLITVVSKTNLDSVTLPVSEELRVTKNAKIDELWALYYQHLVTTINYSSKFYPLNSATMSALSQAVNTVNSGGTLPANYTVDDIYGNHISFNNAQALALYALMTDWDNQIRNTINTKIVTIRGFTNIASVNSYDLTTGW